VEPTQSDILAVTKMHSPSPLLLRALRASTRRRAACRYLTLKDTPSHHALRFFPKGERALRSLSGTACLDQRPRNQTTGPQKSHDRGPKSDEDTQTDFGAMNILGNMRSPATSVDACVSDGFHLNNGLKTTGGSGVMLIGGEAFSWSPWEGTPSRKPAAMLSKVGTLDIGGSGGAWGLLELLWPKPDLLIVGTGGKIWPLSRETREYVNGLGVRIDVMDTGNASAAYNLLATERGTDIVAAAMLPMGWKGR
jgi:NADH dehydrogenase [ubiquinone] 1 alpha subcomplex assembly factor 3